MLSTITGSLIAVIGTVFSLTIVALQLTSVSYTPRVLRNFTSDRGVQAVLETFVATFLCSLLVLRIIRTAEGEATTFTPVISMTVAVLLALLCVALLIYFIAHIVNLIQSSTILSSAHRDAVETVAGLDDLNDGSPGEAEAPEDRPELAGLPRAFAVARLAPEQIPDPEDAANLVVRAVGVGSHLLRTELGVETDLEELADLSKDLRDGERVWKTVRTVLERSGS